MNSRYIGSSDGYQMIDDAANKVRKVSLEAAADMSAAVNRQLDTTIDANARVLALQAQKKAAEANAASQSSGLAGAAQAGASYLLKRHEMDLKNTALMEEEARKLAEAYAKKQEAEDKEKLDKYHRQQAIEAESEVNDVTRAYMNGKFDGQSVEEYKNELVKKLAAYDLKGEDLQRLMAQVNAVALDRDKLINTKLRDSLDQQQAHTASVVKQKLRMDFMADFSHIKQLGVTDQAKPYLDNIEKRLQAFLTENNGLPMEAKLNIAAEMMSMAADNYSIKMENYVGQNVTLRNFQEYVKAVNQAQFEYQNPGSNTYNNYDAMQTAIGLAALKWGDFSKFTPEYGEAEKKRLELSTTVRQLEQVQRDAATQFGASVDLGDDFSKVVAVNAILNPTFAARVNASELRDNPAVRSGLQLYERYQKYLADQAALGVDNTKLDEALARLDLNNANNYVTILDKLAASNAAGQMTEAEKTLQEHLLRAAEMNPDPVYQEFIRARLAGDKKVPIDREVLQQQLNQQAAANNRIAQSIRAQSDAKRAQLVAEYADLHQLGLLVPRENMVNIGKQAQTIFDAKMESVREQLRQRATESINPTPFGIQPNFNGSSSYAPDVDESGRVVVAPRTRLQVLQVGGKSIVTPIQAGGRAPITSHRQPNRWGRPHAGVDFGLNGNNRAVTVVGGIVAHVANHDGYGGTIDIIGDNGYVYRYAHQQALVKKGQRVRAGEAISYSNGSGTGTGNHLHFEVHPKAVIDANGNYVPQFGYNSTIDPIEHLSKLTMGDSNVRKPRQGLMHVGGSYPNMKAPVNALVTASGGAIQANNFQQVGSPNSVGADEVFTYQRPLRLGHIPWKLGTAANIRYDPNDDFGYAELRKNPSWRSAIVSASKQLGIPAVWMADVIAQESGFNHKVQHSLPYIYGLIGFHDKYNPGVRKMNFEQQVQQIVKYYKSNGWDAIRQKKGGQLTIGDFWILVRAGNVKLKRLGNKSMRQFIFDGGNPNDLIFEDFGHSYGYELGLLGKNTGRRYSFPGSNNDRKQRNKSVSTSFVNGCTVCESLVNSGSWVPHIHDIGVA